MGWAAALAILLALPFALPAADAPAECRREAPELWSCAWSFTTDAAGSAWSAPLPPVSLVVAETHLATSYAGPVCWGIDADEGGYERCSDRQQGLDDLRLLELGGAASFRIDGAGPEGGAVEVPTPLPPGTRFEVALLLRELVGVDMPAEPAGSLDDPQVRDASGDSAGDPANDLVAVWFDDALLDDGAFEVGVAVADIDRERAAVQSTTRIVVRWTLLGKESELDFELPDSGAAFDPLVPRQDRWTAHVHYRFTHSDDIAQSVGAGNVDPGVEVATRVDAANGTLVAVIPLEFIGDPPVGAPFSNISARTEAFARSGRYDDVASENVRAFALGGPAVWCQLAGTCGPERPLAWYRAPLAPENVPDTLQALAFVGAVATAVLGFVLVRGSRRKLRRLLREVDDLVARHREDPAALMRELGHLEQRFDDMMIAGRLQEKHHDVLIRRIERAGYRGARVRADPADVRR